MELENNQEISIEKLKIIRKKGTIDLVPFFCLLNNNYYYATLFPFDSNSS